jgi:integrase
MGRLQKQFRLKKRGNYYYYKLPFEKSFHSTGLTSKVKAEQFVIDLIKTGLSPLKVHNTLFEYATPYFLWDSCPHVRRLLDENKSITKRHVSIQRGILINHVFSDPIVNKKISEIKRADIIDFRSRLIKQGKGIRTVNKAVGILKIIFKEALFREDINKDPTVGIGNIKYSPKEVGTFTLDELKSIFPLSELGPWKDKLDYTCFFLAATTGMRRGEILALRWRHIDFENHIIQVEEAWKSKDEVGLPKWNRKRIVPVPDFIIEKLWQLQTDSLQCLPDNLVFCYANGARLGETWWTKHFKSAMEKAGIDINTRNLRPHSYRHTINTLLRDSGHDLSKIRASLGWLSEDAQDNYTHWKTEHLREQANIIENFWK